MQNCKLDVRESLIYYGDGLVNLLGHIYGVGIGLFEKLDKHVLLPLTQTIRLTLIQLFFTLVMFSKRKKDSSGRGPLRWSPV